MEEHLAQASAFLHEQLGDAVPDELTFAGRYEETPLEREGPMSVYSFAASVGGATPQRYWVVAGNTVPNYYPGWGLSADDAYAVHLATRFMLVVGVSRVEPDDVPADAADKVAAFIAAVAPREPIEFLDGEGRRSSAPARPVVCFRCEGELHAVFRVRVGPEEVYVLGLDCPPGIYRDVQLAPHVVYRRHLGNLIRRESK